MPIERISESLSVLLDDVQEIWIASALVTDAGFDYIQSKLAPNAIQHYLVGIDLQTSVSVLKAMMSRIKTGIFDAAIYQTERGIFHPKLYLLKSQGSYTAFVGSANLTKSALSENIELSVQVNDQQYCIKLLKWFQTLAREAYPLNAENIELYEKQFHEQSKLIEQLNSIPKVWLKKKSLVNDQLSDVSFENRYFNKEHHLAFRPEIWKNKAAEANAERQKAHARFLDLHQDLYARFSEYGLWGLEPNKKPHVVSLYYHPDTGVHRNLDAMWLSYGKSEDQIKAYRKFLPSLTKYVKDGEDDKLSFINHTRLQIRIELKSIGIWILFGKNNGGSIYDRAYFLDKMKDGTYRKEFFEQMKLLPEPYWIRVNMVTQTISSFKDQTDLYQFCRKDKPNEYFIIGRDYAIDDEQMSEQLLPSTVLNEFKRLYPIYTMMRHSL